ncbi:D-alanyl-D-alanine carboxypeptidase (penicillin-binding protein 5/6) [Anaerosolibacter carboniphilus]|uniref:D-alanyl-D-alanine carboxypeptidase (Penicillin-binding protein 5/6) n=1 Tax=Anaerosolibacter carboniphilus TaxID=1417629 RepID=A0A841KLL5_9FIRM|nr:serine hydrolase [Anaerosolibacter carboniphilus]MBB6214337.1 D-alanyl-D-alanine carboxypeptidase (penicillin-binding protein 5/6) [Anaerosolibacter carboniphilus]
MCRKRRRKINYGRICILILITMFLMTTAYKMVFNFLPFVKDKLAEDSRSPLSNSESKNIIPPDQEQISLYDSKEELHSPYAMLIRLKDQKVVFETRSEERIYPASLTKIMTAIVAIENIADLQESIILQEKIFPDLYKANASMAGFLPGEEVSAVDLLYGTLLPSGADASMGLALRVSGSENEFVKLMNKKAKKLRLDDTHFTNVSGLHDDNHYTTVKDMAVLLAYALKNETFRQIFTSACYSTASTNLHSSGITFTSTLSKKIDTYEFDGGKVLGGKTGYTDKAGLCLASLTEKNGTEYILVTAGAEGNPYTEQFHIMDAFTVYTKYLKR